MEPDARTTKLVADLLALTLSENDTEAGAALGALRRRAARDAVTAGTLKQWLEALSGRTSLPPPTAPELRQLHEIIEAQRQELMAARQARSRNETTVARARHMEAMLRDAEARASGRSRAWLAALGLGLVLGGGGGFLAGRSLPPPLTTAALHQARSPMTRAAWARLTSFLDTCTLTSSNSLAGSQVRVHLLVAVDSTGHITHAVVAPDQANSFATEEQRDYADMMARTLDGGSCGRLPLPASLTGRAVNLALYLPR